MTLTVTALREALAQNSGEAFLLLLTITHASFAQPVRLAQNTVNVVSRGNTYTAFPFDLPRPSDVTDALATVQLSMSNVGRDLIAAIRSITGPMEVTLEVVAASAPDIVQEGPYSFSLDQGSYTEEVVTGQLGYEPVTREPFPAGAFTPDKFPALHGDS